MNYLELAREPNGSLFLYKVSEFIADNADVLNHHHISIGRFCARDTGVYWPLDTGRNDPVDVRFSPNFTSPYTEKVSQLPLHPPSVPLYPYTGDWTVTTVRLFEGDVHHTRHDIVEVLPKSIRFNAFYVWPKMHDQEVEKVGANGIDVTYEEAISLCNFLVGVIESKFLKQVIAGIRTRRLTAARQAAELLENGEIMYERGQATNSGDRYPRKPNSQRALGRILQGLAADLCRGLPQAQAVQTRSK